MKATGQGREDDFGNFEGGTHHLGREGKRLGRRITSLVPLECTLDTRGTNVEYRDYSMHIFYVFILPWSGFHEM